MKWIWKLNQFPEALKSYTQKCGVLFTSIDSFPDFYPIAHFRFPVGDILRADRLAPLLLDVCVYSVKPRSREPSNIYVYYKRPRLRNCIGCDRAMFHTIIEPFKGNYSVALESVCREVFCNIVFVIDAENHQATNLCVWLIYIFIYLCLKILC